MTTKTAEKIINTEATSHKGKATDDNFEIVEVTPEMASEWLENAATRSPADPRAIDTYKKIMEADAWVMNAQPIIFDERGRLLDGVQRLNACVAADKSFVTVIAKNVRADTLHTIDQHRRRSYTGVLEARGYKNAGSLMRTMSKLIRIENGVLGKEFQKISWSRYDRVLASNPELQEAISLGDQFSRSEIHSTPRPVLAFMALKAGYAQEIRKFLGDTVTGETHGADNAAKRLAFQLLSARSTTGDLDGDHTLALSIMAFNDYLAGVTKAKPYVWNPDYGTAKINPETKLPYDRKVMRASAPANLGLPVMTGAPRLAEGEFNASKFEEQDDLSEKMVQELRGAVGKAGDADIFSVTVTPEMARKWLNDHNRDNRKVQRAHIDIIARDIVNGQWMVNAQPICFTGNPLEDDEPMRLLNGQHRLHACVAANMAIDIPIAINIPEEAFATYDTQAKKGIQTGESAADARNLNAAARFQWRIDSGLNPLSTESPSATDIKNTVERHPEMVEAMAMARKKEFGELGTTGVLTFFIYHVLQDGGKEIGGRYLEQLSTGVGLEEGNPVLRVINKVKGKRGSIPRRDVTKALLDNWEEYKEWRAALSENEKQAVML
ncbi:MAG: hypothetical protein ABJN42_13695 [Roseibium sp.]|uniref:hypothetical protein n=1 Tax=Roseibium sp. TaxID=1936156 RepID=UPI003297D25A